MGVWTWIVSTLPVGALYSLPDPMSQMTTNPSHLCNVLVWNVQGAGSREFLHVLREHIHSHKPSIVAMVETRVSGPRAQNICDLVGFRNNFRVEARGFQGGIWVLWNSDELDIEVLTAKEQFVMMKINPQGQLTWVLTIIYASPQITTRDTLWPDLQQFASDYHGPWLLAGDFNETATLEERNHGGPEMLRRCQRFQSWIDNTGLIDLGYSGCKFTWSRGLSAATRKEARLDRALCNVAWRMRFQEGTVRHLLRVCSDHSSLLISTKSPAHTVGSTRPFRFQTTWASYSQFEGLVHREWQCIRPTCRAEITTTSAIHAAVE